ncbi:MAG TPA: hypothetical protein VGF99_08850 [Myxococcota bacterium]
MLLVVAIAVICVVIAFAFFRDDKARHSKRALPGEPGKPLPAGGRR